MPIEYRELTEEERQSPTHFCNRCERVQPRGQIHSCVPTERWLAAKAAGGDVVHPSLNAVRPVPKAVVLEAVEAAANGANTDDVVNTDAANTEPVSTEPVSSPVDEGDLVSTANSDAPVSTDRKAYMRELMRKKRAEAKAAKAST